MQNQVLIVEKFSQGENFRNFKILYKIYPGGKFTSTPPHPGED